MAQTQRLLKVLQSHPIARPDSHLPYPHLASSSHFASTLPGRTSPPPSSRDGYDVLGDFRRELERVRREVSSMAHTEKVMEQRNRERMEQLAASSVAPSIARDVARSRDDASLMRSTSQAPSQSLLSSINTLLSSPKLNRELAAAKRDSYAKTAPTSNNNNLASSFGLAPSSSHIHTPFASTPSFSPHSSTNGAPSSNDPHMQSLYAKGNVLLTSQSSALDQSHAKLQSILSSLHHWKNVQSAKLSQTVSDIEAKQSQQIKNLIESFELERNRIEERARIATDEAKRAHARAVENHVEDLHHAVERELQRGGGMLGAAFEIHHPELSFSSSIRRSPSRSPSRSSRSRLGGAAELERSSRILSDSMRMEHLGSSANHNTQQHHHHAAADDEEEDEKESQRAIARRKKLYYSSAVNGASSLSSSASASSLAHSLNSTSLKEGGRKSVNSLLYSSDDEETDAASIQKKELLAQARFIQSSRLKDTGRNAFSSSTNSSSFNSSFRSAPHSSPVHSRDPRNELLVNEGISGRSRGRGKAVTKSAQVKAERARADARVLLESSSSEEDEDPEVRKQRQLHQLTQSEKEERRRKLGVSFGPDASRSPSPSPSPSPSRKRRSEKEEAAAVFAETSSDEEVERNRPLGGVHTSSVTSGTQAGHIPPATSGRIHASPQKSARQRNTSSNTSSSSSLKEMSQQLQKKVATLNLQSASVKQISNPDLADD